MSNKSDYGQNFNAEVKNQEGKFKSKISGEKQQDSRWRRNTTK